MVVRGGEIMQDKLLDVIRLALLDCRIDHDDVGWMAEKIRRRICEAATSIEDAWAKAYWEKLGRLIEYKTFPLIRDSDEDDIKVGGTD